MIWSQSRNGRAIDLLNPRADQVDFREIAETLSHINRYAGATHQPVSVGMHTLIVLDLVPAEIAPYAALHDAPEAYLGDQTRPFIQALMAEIAKAGGSPAAYAATMANKALHNRHFRALCEAARLPHATPAIWEAIDRADNIALLTERKWFMADPPQPWNDNLESLAPLIPRRPYRWKAPDKIADALYEKFQQLLPALRRAC